jgi:hypothetical protein
MDEPGSGYIPCPVFSGRVTQVYPCGQNSVCLAQTIRKMQNLVPKETKEKSISKRNVQIKETGEIVTVNEDHPVRLNFNKNPGATGRFHTVLGEFVLRNNLQSQEIFLDGAWQDFVLVQEKIVVSFEVSVSDFQAVEAKLLAALPDNVNLKVQPV